MEWAFSARRMSWGESQFGLSSTSLSCFLNVALDRMRFLPSNYCLLSILIFMVWLIELTYFLNIQMKQNGLGYLDIIITLSQYYVKMAFSFLNRKISKQNIFGTGKQLFLPGGKVEQTQSDKMSIFLKVLVCMIALSMSQVLVDDNYAQYVDNTVPQPAQIQIQKQNISIKAEATIPIQIFPPQSIAPLYYSNILNKLSQNCTLHQVQTQKLYGDYIKFKKDQLGKFQGWPISILDATYSLQSQIVHAVLTNGSLIRTKLRKEVSGEGTHLTQFQIFDYHKTQTDAIWQLDEYSMFTTQGRIYLLRQKQLFKAVFTQNNKWSMEPLSDGDNINRVRQLNDDLYIVKSKNIYKIVNDSVGPNLLKQDKLPEDKIELVDVDIDNGVMYALSKSEGVMMFNISKNYQFIVKYLFDFHEYAYRINVKKNTVLINFRLYRKTFIGQFFLIPSDIESYTPAFKLNKFYYRFDEMHNVVLFEQFGLVYSLSEINFFQHSVNRNIPFGELETSNIYTASYPKVLDVIPLDQKNLHYILVEKNGIFVQSFGNAQKGNLLKSRITCLFKQSGNYEIAVKYLGFCKDNIRPSQAYCSKEQTYLIDVNNEKQKREVQAFNDHLFIALILAVVFVLVIGGILAYRRVTLENRQKLNALLEEKRKFDQMNKEKVRGEVSIIQKQTQLKNEGQTIN